ncbi:MAG: hypothetical protein ACO1PI_07385 [Bacteroidota bacterium]
MKKVILSVAVLAALSAIVATSSCSKVEEEIKNTTTTAEDITRTETYLASVFNITTDVSATDGRLSKTGSNLLPAGVEVQFIDSSFTDGDDVEYFVDFGALPGKLCQDGVTRAGRVDVKQSKRFSEIGCIVEINLPDANNFQVSTTGGMTKLTGKAIITRLAANKTNLKIQGGKAENATDGTVTFDSDKDMVTEELGAPGIVDDVFKGFGSGSGTNTKGKPYTWKTKDTMVKIEQPNCSFPIKGIIELTSEKSTYVIDFEPDGGACDKKVVITLPNGTKVPKTF